MKTINFHKIFTKMKKTVKTSLNEMRNFAAKMPKTINEMLNLGEEDDMEMENEPMDEPAQEPQEEGMNVEAFVDDIRKKALKGMAQLAENPEDPRYQILKKIWQICDKKPEDQQGAMQQRQQGM